MTSQPDRDLLTAARRAVDCHRRSLAGEPCAGGWLHLALCDLAVAVGARDAGAHRRAVAHHADARRSPPPVPDPVPVWCVTCGRRQLVERQFLIGVGSPVCCASDTLTLGDALSHLARHTGATP